MRRGGVAEKKLRGGVCRRWSRRQNAGGGGTVAKKIGGMYAGEGKESKMQGEGCEKNLKVGVCRRGYRRQNTGGCCGKKIEGDTGEG